MIRLLLSFAILLAILLDSPSAQTKKGSKTARAPAAKTSAKAGDVRAAPPLVCIDPGHPSEVSRGDTLQNGTTEVQIVWAVALKLKKLLEAKNYRVVMTKEEEMQLVENRARALVANDAKAALMIRLHCDASEDTGFAVYYPDRQGTTQGVTGPTAEVIEASRRAAEAVRKEMASALADVLKDGGVRGDSQTLVGSKQGALTGSIFSEVPVVTVEMVVLSNESDAEFIKAEEGQQRMAQAIAEGVRLFIETPPPPPRPAPRGKRRKQITKAKVKPD